MNTEIILNLLTIIIGLYLAIFKSYFQEKGKNIATSEDIGKITLQVESVKQQFLEKNASLKSKLDLITNLETSHKNDERLAIIDFHKKIKTWIGLLTESTPSLLDEYNDNDIEIQSKIHLYDLTYKEVLSAEALLELYINDQKLIELISNFKIQILKSLRPNPIKYLVDIKLNNYLIKQLESEQEILIRDKSRKELYKERLEIHRFYSISMIKGYKEIMPYNKEYIKYTREYLLNIYK
jgi:hypothetical protein